jgi:LysR family hydrogen peroxide-inducible transcriptional activator
MSTYLPTLKQLQYLVALNDAGHFGRAADACFVSQSTLSAGLRELETLIGVTLVERTRRVVRFTPLGQQIAAKARKVLREADELADMARAAGKPLGGELRMGVIPTIAPFLLPGLLPRLRADYPDLKLYLREETSQAACDNLHRGQLDCVLLALPFACGEVEAAPLFDDRLFVAFGPGSAADLPEMSARWPPTTPIAASPWCGAAPAPAKMSSSSSPKPCARSSIWSGPPNSPPHKGEG